jgi:RNA recognition motif-containing protein
LNKKLHVGNLSYATTEDDLRRLFGEVGPVASVSIITDRMSGRSKGFGFVEMETPEAAQQAIERLNDHQLDERSITVSEARPPQERDRSFGDGGRRGDRGGGRSGPSRGGRDRRPY